MAIQQITIIGTGLIGGSLALSLKSRKLVPRIIGCDRDEILARAKAAGAIDHGIADPLAACRGSQVVVLAVPVGAIIDMLERLGPALPADTLLTDVGSTKAEIVARGKAIFGKQAGARFLAGHPMAGKEFSGIDQADANLFQGATWFLVADESDHSAHPHAEDYKSLLRSIGANLVPISANRHDELCAFISHLPQMVSTAMAGVALDYREHFSEPANPELDIGKITSRGLREMTRTASSPYSMWRDIALTNSANIERALLALEHRLAHMRENLKTPELRAQFERAAQIAPRKPAK
jgi:prephenate dehydrogenase